MSKRENIIVGLMIIVVLYGGYVLFFEGKSKPQGIITSDQSQSLSTVLPSIQASMAKTKASDIDAYKLKQAELPWQSDPFFTEMSLGTALKDFLSKKGSDVFEEADFVYTGFIQMDSERIAIINGREYTVGEQLEARGFYVDKIFSNSVVITRKNRQNQPIGQRSIPIQENTIFP